VRKCALCVILLLTLPAFATISNIQSNANWSCSNAGNSITCVVTLTTQPTMTGNLLAVWTFWQSVFPYTASVDDHTTGNNTWYSAVGPTLQSASSTSGQIFYAKKINGSGVGHNEQVVMACPKNATSPSAKRWHAVRGSIAKMGPPVRTLFLFRSTCDAHVGVRIFTASIAVPRHSLTCCGFAPKMVAHTE